MFKHMCIEPTNIDNHIVSSYLIMCWLTFVCVRVSITFTLRQTRATQPNAVTSTHFCKEKLY